MLAFFISDIASLKLASNLFTGTICPELGNLLNLCELFLDNNELTGSLPKTLMNLVDLSMFTVAGLASNLVFHHSPSHTFCHMLSQLTFES